MWETNDGLRVFPFWSCWEVRVHLQPNRPVRAKQVLNESHISIFIVPGIIPVTDVVFIQIARRIPHIIIIRSPFRSFRLRFPCSLFCGFFGFFGINLLDLPLYLVLSLFAKTRETMAILEPVELGGAYFDWLLAQGSAAGRSRLTGRTEEKLEQPTTKASQHHFDDEERGLDNLPGRRGCLYI